MEDFGSRRARFDSYIQRWRTELGERFTCPCCAYPTLHMRGQYEICPLCRWEDDNQDDPKADRVWGGPNGDYSLSEARLNFAEHMIMYRVNETAIFPQNPRLLVVKRELIDLYERMALAELPQDAAGLLAKETDFIRRLLIIPQQIMPLPGR